MPASNPAPAGPVKIEICNRLINDWRDLADYFKIPLHEQARFERGDESRAIWAWLESHQRLDELADGLRFIGRDELAKLLLQRQQESANRYYQSCKTRWSQPRFALDKRFVQLTLLVDQGPDAQGPRWQTGKQFQELRQVLDDVTDQAIVLLGPPGSGKSTLLRHFELDNARLAPASAQARFTFFVQLNEYRRRRSDEPLPLPRDWLVEQWAKVDPDLPDLVTLWRQQRITLLLDALNEMPSGTDEPIRRWKEFLQELDHDFPGNRVIFSCRSLDYGATLSSKELPVPQVRIEWLSDSQVQRFLELYCPQHAAALWRNLEKTPQLELLRLPYFLRLLVEQTVAGEVPEGRAGLFTGFVRQTLKREVEGDHRLFQPGMLLDEQDRKRIAQVKRWKTPHELPSRGILFPRSLSDLGSELQFSYHEAEKTHILRFYRPFRGHLSPSERLYPPCRQTYPATNTCSRFKL